MEDHELDTNVSVDQPSFLWQQFISTFSTDQHSDQPKSTLHPSPARSRGRPRRITPSRLPGGVTVHKIEDDERDIRSLTAISKRKIRADFKEYLSENVPAQQALIYISNMYEIPYSQAFKLTEDIFDAN